MSLLGKLKFWKHDEPNFDALADQELGIGKNDFGSDNDSLGGNDPLGINRTPPGLDERSPFDPSYQQAQDGNAGNAFNSGFDQGFRNRFQQPQQQGFSRSASGQGYGGGDRELELINSKLDTLKALLTSMEQRLANLEKAAGIEEKRRLW